MAKQDDWIRITLRLPRDLHARLTSASEAGSLNATIIEALEEKYPAPVKQSITDYVLQFLDFAAEDDEEKDPGYQDYVRDIREQILRAPPDVAEEIAREIVRSMNPAASSKR